ncbi:MAG TPA: hypothetical protein P5081_03745 [Phycisphaerae bacterium]|nr:hypothetical protein [Phycisphaerae bacterium]HRW51973.1 hypothetical protein [Phycisphaerae bacterium]
MTDEASIRVLLFASDLMFQSRISAEARGACLGFGWAGNLAKWTDQLASAERPLILVDMDLADAPSAIQSARAAFPEAAIVAYYAHVRNELRQSALDAGATSATPRSRFVTELPSMLKAQSEPS